MSAFDDEFGLFGEEEGEEAERRPTLGARNIGANETVIDEVELDEQPQRREQREPREPQRQPAQAGGDRRRRDDRPSYGDRPHGDRPSHGGYGDRPQRRRNNVDPNDPWAGHRRASTMLDFLAKKLVTEPERVAVELFLDEQQQPVIELIVAPDDLGKVIGRNGRVAHALRTLVRATAESRVSVDILNTEEAGDDEGDDSDAE
ncbi:MAG TPA: KH domain-containing protein [Candidatus Tumulicola sp.]|jgi:hypothetical protein